MIEKNMTNAQLQKQAGFSANVVARLKSNDCISLEGIESSARL